MSHSKTLLVFVAAALSLGLIDQWALRFLPILNLGDLSKALDRLRETQSIVTWTGWASLLGILLAGLVGDKHVWGRPLHEVGLGPSLALAGILFAASSLFILYAPGSSHVSLSLYFLIVGIASFWLYASMSSAGNTSAERLRIFILLAVISSIANELSKPIFTKLVIEDSDNVRYYIFGITLIAVALAIPAVLARLRPNATSQTHGKFPEFFITALKHPTLQKIGCLVFLLSFSAALSSLHQPEIHENRNTLFAAMIPMIVAMIPATYVLMRLAKSERVTPQNILFHGAWIMLACSLITILATTLQFHQLGLFFYLSSSIITIFIGAAVLTTLSEFSSKQQAISGFSHFAKYMLLYFVVLEVGGYVGFFVRWSTVSLELDRQMVSASLSVAIWGIFLVCVMPSDKPSKQNSSALRPPSPNS